MITKLTLLEVRGLLLSQRAAKVLVLASKARTGLRLALQKEFCMVPYVYMYVYIYMFSRACVSISSQRFLKTTKIRK